MAARVSEYIPIAINSKIETEDVLGPLPEHWEKTDIKIGGRTRSYFVDHKSKKTTWIDPRTAMLRKHNVNDIVAGELPYGWEELWDEEYGVYYTDHTTQTNYADPPWNDDVKEKVLALKSKLGQDLKRMSTNARIKAENDEQKIKTAERALNDLQSQKKKVDASRQPSEVKVDTRDYEIERKLSELRHLNDKLDGENKNLISEVQATSMELNDIRQMIEAERAQRAALESYVLQLKQELLQKSSPEQARAAQEYDENAAAEAAAEEAELPSIDDEHEISRLRTRLRLEQQERQNLREITENLLREKEDKADQSNNYYAPNWVQEIDVHARAKILRKKIVNGGINPDTLDFNQKLNKFAVASQNDSKPKVPSKAHNPTSEHAVRARETAFGKVEWEDGDEVAREFDY
ncbi:Membrane-associated guanylate kinase, WW and PDZ domain-containing protein 2 [Phlyctochytrium bullatum]|nr:Membrane-associated guanylate kinase, WW and PDZ domain-containing protein 2 [Phlyctochytrium bullatum]